MKRSEFLALMNEDKHLFKKELFSILENKISEKITLRYVNESKKILSSIKTKKIHKIKEQIEVKPVTIYMPINEVNSAINNNRTNWLLAKDGSNIEITPKMAKYLAELYKSLNNLHKEKLVKLITESEHGFKKALKTAERLYGENNGHH